MAPKEGVTPPSGEMDVASGKMINPHNPDFVTQRPWYLGESGPSLSHHVARKDRQVSMAEADAAVAAARSKWEAATKAAEDEAPAVVAVGTWIEALYQGKRPWLPAKVSKVRLDGSLDLSFENGRSSTRVSRNHVKIPKASGGSRSALTNSQLSWDGKRDLWHGYDASKHQEAAVRRYAEMDAERAAIGEEEVELKDDEQKDFQRRIARQGGVGGAQMKTTVRNLRIREDTAKYLRNLDPQSAYYDPKSRAMRENPTPHLDPSETVYAGDNFARATGDAVQLSATEVFAWDVERKGAPAGGDLVHVQAEPSRVEMLKKEFDEKRRALEESRRVALLDKYGNAAVKDETPDEMKIRIYGAQSETYREYAEDGTRLPAADAPLLVPSSKYVEDVLVNNHTEIWGSYFSTEKFKWGYADDHSLVRNSYSIGEKGKMLSSSSTTMVTKKRPTLPPQSEERQPKTFKKTSDLYGSTTADSLSLDEDKVAKAMEKYTKRQQHTTSSGGYNSLSSSSEVTPEEMEAYRRSKLAANDPMANFLK